MPLVSTLPTGSKPTLPATTNITRVTLSNGYRAYHPKTETDKPHKPKKTVRFVKGHTTIPDVPFPKPLTGATPDGGKEGETRETDAEQTVDESGTQQPAKISNTAAPVEVTTTTTTTRKPAGATLKLVHQNGTPVWRKTPRFRGSGFQQVLDDPVKEGLELALTAAVRLPSDRWRDRYNAVPVRRAVGRGKNGLRLEEGEREGGFSMGDVVRDVEEVGVVVRVVTRKGTSGKKGKKGGKGAGLTVTEVENAEEEKETREEEVLDESVALSEAGSDSESGDDYDFLHDFSLEESEGWVPVMVAEEDQGDDWMSLTGSWIRLGDPGDAKK